MKRKYVLRCTTNVLNKNAYLNKRILFPFMNRRNNNNNNNNNVILNKYNRFYSSPGDIGKGEEKRRKVALITGSTSGLGLAIAEKFASQNYALVINGFGDGEGVQKMLSSKYSVPVLYHGADLSDSSQITSLFSNVLTHYSGGLDVLINNAGIQHISPIHNFPVTMWDKVLSVNLTACFHTTRLALSVMLLQGYGRIINIASVHGLVASVNKSAYVAAKHGLVGFTKATALETAGKGITANCINPGWIWTDLVADQAVRKMKEEGLKSIEDAKKKILQEKQPSGKFVEAKDVAEIAAFLASDAAKEITGICLTVDGGWTAQ